MALALTSGRAGSSMHAMLFLLHYAQIENQVMRKDSMDHNQRSLKEAIVGQCCVFVVSLYL